MPKYVIERDIPGIADSSPADQVGIAQKSRAAIAEIGSEIQWVESYVTQDKTYCVYIAPSADQIRQHAALTGFPANAISEVKAILDPTTAEG